MPTRKWVAARIVGACVVAAMWATSGTWDLEETLAALGLISEAATAYLTPNEG